MKRSKNSYRPRLPKQDEDLWAGLIAKVKEIGIIEASLIFSNNRPNTKETQVFEGDKWEIHQDATPIKSKEQLIEACNIDLDIWDIPKFRVSSWGQNSKTKGHVQLYSIKATLVKKEVSSLDRFLDKLEKGAYKIPSFATIKGKAKKSQNKCSIINIYDAHLDKVTRATETGEFSDISKNVSLFRQAFNGLLSESGVPEKIIFPIGNDLFNVNDTRNTTKKGTPQATYLHHADAFEIVLDMMVDLIENAANLAPVYIPMVAGNHDTDAIHQLGVVLSKMFRKSKHIGIDYSRIPRKYVKYGNNMFMFEHGDGLKLNHIPVTMAQEQADMWANTQYRYAYLGHLHHTKEYQFNRTIDDIGVQVRHLRAMSAKDEYHTKKGYIGIPKSAELVMASECGKDYYSIVRSF